MELSARAQRPKSCSSVSVLSIKFLGSNLQETHCDCGTHSQLSMRQLEDLCRIGERNRSHAQRIGYGEECGKQDKDCLVFHVQSCNQQSPAHFLMLAPGPSRCGDTHSWRWKIVAVLFSRKCRSQTQLARRTKSWSNRSPMYTREALWRYQADLLYCLRSGSCPFERLWMNKKRVH